MSDPSAIAKIRSAAATAFDKIGKQNGSAPPQGDNTDPLLHEYYIARELQAMATKRADKAKDRLLDDEETGLGIEAAAMKVKEGASGNLLTSQHYTLTLNHAVAAEIEDIEMFISALRRAGVAADIISVARRQCKKKRAGAKTYKVMPNL